MAKETKGKQNEKLAAEIGDPTRRRAVALGLGRQLVGADEAWKGINRAIDDPELMHLSDLADHLATARLAGTWPPCPEVRRLRIRRTISAPVVTVAGV